MGTATVTFSESTGHRVSVQASYEDTDPTDMRINDQEKANALEALGQRIAQEVAAAQHFDVDLDSFTVSLVEDSAQEDVTPDAVWRNGIARLLAPNPSAAPRSASKGLTGGTLTPAEITALKSGTKTAESQFLLCVGEAKNPSDFTSCVETKMRELRMLGVMGQGQMDDWAKQIGFPIRLPAGQGGELIASDEKFDDKVSAVLKRCPDKALGERLGEMYGVYSEYVRLASNQSWLLAHTEDLAKGENQRREFLTAMDAAQRDLNFSDKTLITQEKIKFIRMVMNGYFKKTGRSVTINDQDTYEVIVTYNNIVRFYSEAAKAVN